MNKEQLNIEKKCILHKLKNKRLVIKKEYKKIDKAFKIINILSSSIDENRLLKDYKESIDNKYPSVYVYSSLKKQVFKRLVQYLASLITNNPFDSCNVYNSFSIEVKTLDSSKNLKNQVSNYLNNYLCSLVNRYIQSVNNYLAM